MRSFAAFRAGLRRRAAFSSTHSFGPPASAARLYVARYRDGQLRRDGARHVLDLAQEPLCPDDWAARVTAQGLRAGRVAERGGLRINHDRVEIKQ